MRTVTFTVTDDTALSDSATRGISVAAVNDPPTAVDDTGTTDEDTTLNVAAPGVLANDTDVDPGDTKTVVALNGTGTLTQPLPSGASVTINANGSYSYNPLSAFQGLSTGQTASDSFTYTMQDGAGAQDTATVNLTINGISDAPTAVADSFDAIGNTGLFVGTSRPATQAGKEITGSVLTNDTTRTPRRRTWSPSPLPTRRRPSAAPSRSSPTATSPTTRRRGHRSHRHLHLPGCDAAPCNSGTAASAAGTLSLPIAGQVRYVRNNGRPAATDVRHAFRHPRRGRGGQRHRRHRLRLRRLQHDHQPRQRLRDERQRAADRREPSALARPATARTLPNSPNFPGTSGAQPTLTAPGGTSLSWRATSWSTASTWIRPAPAVASAVAPGSTP